MYHHFLHLTVFGSLSLLFAIDLAEPTPAPWKCGQWYLGPHFLLVGGMLYWYWLLLLRVHWVPKLPIIQCLYAPE